MPDSTGTKSTIRNVGNERGPVNQPWNPRIREARSMRSRIRGKWIGEGGRRGRRAAPPRGQCPLLSTDEITIIDRSPFNGSSPDRPRSIRFFSSGEGRGKDTTRFSRGWKESRAGSRSSGNTGENRGDD